jgi:PAS domain S-box-containing protein
VIKLFIGAARVGKVNQLLPEAFDLKKLSVRENQILELAVEGLTDVQIALRLTIAPSTVNSYWVRIRGKLGSLSRTEFVAFAVRTQSNERIREVLEKSREWEERADRNEQNESDSAYGEFYRSVLDRMPEAVFVIDGKGSILYTNERLDVLFGYRPKELGGVDISLLMPPRLRETQRAEIEACMREPGPLRLGIDRVVYGRRQNGTQMRIIMLLDGKSTSQGVFVTGIVRNFIEEVDLRRRAVSAITRTMFTPPVGTTSE